MIRVEKKLDDILEIERRGKFDIAQPVFMSTSNLVKDIELWRIRTPVEGASVNLDQLKIHHHQLLGDKDVREVASTINKDIKAIEKSLKETVKEAQNQLKIFNKYKKEVQKGVNDVLKFKGVIDQ